MPRPAPRTGAEPRGETSSSSRLPCKRQYASSSGHCDGVLRRTAFAGTGTAIARSRWLPGCYLVKPARQAGTREHIVHDTLGAAAVVGAVETTQPRAHALLGCRHA